MANTITARTPFTGREFGFTISGDAPTVDEQRRIDSILRQQEEQYFSNFQQDYGVDITPEDARGSGFANYVGEVPKGIIGGAAGMLESGALGLASLLPQGMEDSAREAIRRAGYNVQQSVAPDWGLEDTNTRRFSEGLGSFGGLLATAAVSPWAGLGLAVSSGTGEASERAYAAGATQEERNQALLPGAAVGALEMIPIGTARFLRRAVGEGGIRSVVARIARAGAEGGIEAAQEAAAQVAQNFIQQGYDPDQEIMQGVGESAFVGGQVGAFVQGLLDLALPRRRGGNVAPPDPVLALPSPDSFPPEPLPPSRRITGPRNDGSGPTINVAPEVGQTQRRIEQGQGPALLESTPTRDAPTARSTPDVIRLPETGQPRPRDTNVPSVRPGATARVTPGPLDPQMAAAVEAMRVNGKSTVQTIMDALNLSYPAANGIMRKLEGAGVVTPYQPGRPRRLTAPFETPATREVENVAEATTTVPEEAAAEPGGRDTADRLVAEVSAEKSVGETKRRLSDIADDRPDDAPAGSGEGVPSDTRRGREVAESSGDVQPAGGPQVPDSGGLAVSDGDTGDAVDAAGPVRDALEEPAPNVPQNPPSLDRNAAPGRTTEGAQVIPPGIPGAARAAAPTQAAPTPDVAADRAISQAERAANERLTGELRNAWADKFVNRRGKRPPIAREQRDLTAEDTPGWKTGEPDSTAISAQDILANNEGLAERSTSSDKRTILSLIQRGVGGDKRRATNPEYAALTYFKTNPSPTAVVDEIAFDMAEYRVDGKAKYTDGDPYFAGKGGTAAYNAGRWVRDNLSPDMSSYMFQQMQKYAGEFEASASTHAIQAKLDADTLRRRTEQDILETEHIATPRPTGKGLASFGHYADGPLHPMATAALRNDNFKKALAIIDLTSKHPRAQQVASKLYDRVGDARTIMLTSEEMDAKSTEFLGSPGAAALYVPGENVVYIEEANLTPATVMHEAVHVATHAELRDNPNGPYARSINQLREKLRESLGDMDGFLVSNDEFLAEAMTNHRFRQQLAIHNMDGTKRTALQWFKRATINFIRNLVGLPPRGRDSAMDNVDQMFDMLLDSDPRHRGAGVLYETSYALPKMRGEAMNRMQGRIQQWGPEAARRVDSMLTSNLAREAKKVTLRATTPLRNMVDMAKKYIPNAENVYKLIEQHGAEVHRGAQVVNETIDDVASMVPQDEFDTFNEVRMTASLMQLDPRKDRTYYSNYFLFYDEFDSKGVFKNRQFKSYKTEGARDAALVNLNATTDKRRSKAKRIAGLNAEQREVWNDLKTKYENLSPKSKQAYQRTVSMWEHFHKETGRVLKARIMAAFDGDTGRAQQVYTQIYNRIMANQPVIAYQPLQRMGSHWLTYRVMDGPLDTEGTLFKESFETFAAREERIRQLEEAVAEDGADLADVETYHSGARRQAQQSVPTAFFADVMDKIRESGQMTPDLEQELAELFFDTAPEQSYIQRYRRRKGVRGFLGDVMAPNAVMPTKTDTIQMLRQKGMSISKNIADIEYGVKVDKQLKDMRDHVSRSRNFSNRKSQERAQIFHEVLEEYGQAMKATRSPWSRNVTAATYGLTLGFNVSTAALTMFQLPTIIIPFLSGRYTLGQTTKYLGNAMRTLTASGNTRQAEFINDKGEIENREKQIGWYDYSLSNYDFDNLPNADLARYKSLRDEMQARGVFNRSITQDILDFESNSNLLQRVVSWSGYLQHHAERYIRESTSIAAYDMEIAKRLKERGLSNWSDLTDAELQNAANEAVYVSEITNGTLLATGAPLWAQSNVGAIIYLFKRFGLHMFHLMINSAARSVGKASPDRRVARLQLAGMLGSVALFSGAQGLPMFQAVADMFNLLFTDDDEEDFETLVRTSLGEFGYSGIANQLTGLNLASRIGLSGMFYREPFNSANNSPLTNLIEGIGGPAVSMFNKYAPFGGRVGELIGQGQIYRAVETAMPSAVANPMRTYRYASEGINTLRGDPLVGDISPHSYVAQFFGFAPASYIQQLEQNSQYRRIDRAINDQKTDLLRRRYMAIRSGDRDEYREAMRAIREYNREYPQNAITGETMRRSLSQHRDTTEQMHHGVLFSSQNRQLLTRMTEEWGPASFFDS